jgi:fructose-1,6-bisphosphatase/sedoheptulose 1,7-bisphosphatase-like protein
MKSFHLDLVRVTETGAISAAEWVGRGNKEEADLAATEAMRKRLNQCDFCATIAIGEGKKDESHGLYEGEIVGAHRHKGGKVLIPRTDAHDGVKEEDGSKYDIAIDPIEGTTPTATGGYEAMSVIAIANKDCFYKTDHFYMDKLAVGATIAKRAELNINDPPQITVNTAAAALGKEPHEFTVCVLDRPRTKPLIAELRKTGCRIKFISDCDVTACIAVCVLGNGIDMYWSIGGSPEAVIAAAAMKCMGGWMQCIEYDKNGDDVSRVNDTILSIEDLAKGPTMFAGTGITDGKLLKGVRYQSRGIITNSIAMRSESGTVRRFHTQHGN